MSRLKNADAAEDAVQEALLGGLKNLSHFPPESDIGPWLMGILKKKVVDRQRQSTRVDTATGDSDPILDKLFNKDGNWTEAARTADPLRLDSLEQSEFMEILKRCLTGLPPNQAAVFVGRELNERNPEDLCKELDVSTTNLWVLMHRARLRLAECIRARWAMGEA
jgi:RNA polymerase sigma-70 factor (ECF subfamily)